MAVKQKRIKCARCGERETVMRGERGPASIYCDLCRDEAKREQNAFVGIPSLVQAAPSSSSRKLTTGLLCGMVRADPVV